VAAVLAMAAPGAWAQGCVGTYAATALHPLPQPTVAGIDIRDPSPENQRLAARFMQGVRAAGVRTEGAANVAISVTYSLLGLGPDRPGGGESASRSDFAGLSGGLSRGLPPEGRMRIAPPAHPHGPVSLVLRADATRPGAGQVLWVLSLQCRLGETDADTLAEEIGRVVGGALGRTVARRPL